MKRIICLLIMVLMSSGIALNAQKFELPREVKKYKIGMTEQKFRKKNKMTEGPNQMFGFRNVYAESNPSDKVAHITYYFDNEGQMPLYEYIIEYHSEEERDKVAAKLYEEPNNGKEWEFDSKAGYKIRVWKFQKKLVIAAILPGTEWDEE